MTNLKKLIILVVAVAIIISGLFLWRKSQQSNRPNPANNSIQPSSSAQPTDKPQIISTKPDPLNEAIIPASQTIEITFNKSLENVGEFKLKMEPANEFKLELSQDRKTAKIIPVKPYELGVGYTIFIGPETKFDGIGRWGEEKIFHFRTIKYRGV